MTTEQRLNELERQLRRTRGWLAAIVLAAIAAVCIGQQQPAASDTVKAKRFVVVDAKGQERAVLGLDKNDFASLLVNDDKGKPRAAIGVGEKNATGFVLLNAAGTPRVAIEVRTDGLPRLSFYDDTHNVCALLRMTEGNTPRFELSDVNGKSLFKAP